MAKGKQLVHGTLVCQLCGQTKQMYLPQGVTPDLDAHWHTCDPTNVNSPERLVSNDVLRTLTHIYGKPLRIGGISAEDSAFNDVKRRSTKKL
jgi:hypothetical protein